MSETAYQEAIRTLKGADTVAAADGGEATLQRIQASLQLERPRQLRRRRQLLVLMAAGLAASSALAFYLAETSEEPRTSVRQGHAAPVTPASRSPLPPAPPAQAAPLEPVPALVTDDPPATTGEARRSRAKPRSPVVDSSHGQTSAQAPVAASRATEAEGTSTATPVSSEATTTDQQALYMTAHRLHFGPLPQSALAAWDAYLATRPTGPLAIEARYNRAVVLARLGQRDAARRELLPFAEGHYGSFRQADAALLLSQLK